MFFPLLPRGQHLCHTPGFGPHCWEGSAIFPGSLSLPSFHLRYDLFCLVPSETIHTGAL